jgi:hypothetical protein
VSVLDAVETQPSAADLPDSLASVFGRRERRRWVDDEAARTLLSSYAGGGTMRIAAMLMLVTTLSGAAEAAVLCAKPERDGTLNGSVTVRQVCKRNEVQLAPADVNFCCTSTTVTTTTSTSGPCPTFTTSTLGIPDCGFGSVCFGLCANARACTADTSGSCSCTGPELPCGVVTAGGTCGGTCPGGFTCALFSPTLPNGCPDIPRCGCIPSP